MTRILRNTVAAAFVTAAAMTLAGCPSGTGANIPGTGGTLGASTAPTTGGGNQQTGGAGACDRNDPSGTPVTGATKHGAYNGQRLPMGYDNLTDEAAVTAAIRKEDGGANWACFQKFYPGAVTVYNGKKM